jgi:hypothetical protein
MLFWEADKFWTANDARNRGIRSKIQEIWELVRKIENNREIPSKIENSGEKPEMHPKIGNSIQKSKIHPRVDCANAWHLLRSKFSNSFS